jgi:hypothetical protein
MVICTSPPTIGPNIPGWEVLRVTLVVELDLAFAEVCAAAFD